MHSIEKTTIDSCNQVAEQYVQRNHNKRVNGEILIDSQTMSLLAGGLVLDIGCGPGFDVELFKKKDSEFTA